MLDKSRANNFSVLATDRLLDTVDDTDDFGKRRQRYLAERHAAVFFVFGLECAGKVFIAFVGHHV